MIKAAILLAIVTIAAAQQSITYTDGGNPFTYFQDATDLSLAAVTEACKTGVWVTYTGTNYDGFLVEIFPEIELSCHTPFAATTGSTRFAGLDTGYNLPSASLFSTISLGGTKTVVGDAGLASITHLIQSIVTVNAEVELYELADWDATGKALCLDLSAVCNNGVCWSWSLSSTAHGWDITNAKSVKIGCSPRVPVVKVIPDNVSTINVL